jgi:mannose-6-phosphate isomerase-like protein (cupin superfamily)
MARDEAMTTAISLAEKLAAFDDLRAPRTVATFNGHDVMVVKIDGAFHWHEHADSDDLFPVLKGELTIELEGGRAVHLRPGELHITPKGMKHRPVAKGETHVLLLERTGTPNTGDAATAAPRAVI